MLRTVLAVIVGYVTLAVLVMAAFSVALFAPGFAFRPASVEVTPGFQVYTLVVSFVAAAVGGAVAALIGRSRRAGCILAGLVLVFGIAEAVKNAGKPTPTVTPEQVETMTVAEMAAAAKQPQWYALVLPLLGAGGALVGATLAKRS